MADQGQYTTDDDDGNAVLDEGFVAEALMRALEYGVPYRLYAEAFVIADDANTPIETCSNILSAVVDAAVWGASNARHVLMQKQIGESLEETEHGEDWI